MQTVDERCNELAEAARLHTFNMRRWTLRKCLAEDFDYVSGLADRIIAERTAQFAVLDQIVSQDAQS